MRKRWIGWIVCCLAWSAVPVAGQQNTTGPWVSPGNAIRYTVASSNQCNISANTFTGSPLLFTPIAGVGGCLAVGQTITGSALTGGTGTILGISAWPSQTVPAATSATTHTSTTLDGISTAVCAQVKKYMWVNGTDIVGKADPTTKIVSATPTYTTTDCAAGSVTLSQAASGSHTTADFNFTPAILVSVNASATHTPQSDFASFVAGASQNALTLSYTVNGVTTNLTQTPATDYSKTVTTSAALPYGTLNSVAVSVASGPAEKGAIAVDVELMAGANIVARLACGSPTSDGATVWLGHCDASEMQRERLLVAPRPIAGAQSILSVPAGVSWYVIGGQSIFQASATAGIRNLSMSYLDREGIGSATGATAGSQLFGPSDLVLVQFGVNMGQTPTSAGYAGPFLGSQFSVDHAPAANTQATISRAAPGAGFRNVIECVMGTLVSTTAASAGLGAFLLRDGATGAGTIQWALLQGVPATLDTAVGQWICPPSPWRMSANTATTFETSAATGAGTTAYVSMKGYVETVVQVLTLPIPNPLVLRGGGLARIIFAGGNNVDDQWTEPQVKVIEQWILF